MTNSRLDKTLGWLIATEIERVCAPSRRQPLSNNRWFFRPQAQRRCEIDGLLTGAPTGVRGAAILVLIEESPPACPVANDERPASGPLSADGTRFIWESTSAGGVIIPPDRAKAQWRWIR
jgi:hypothetical protein